jgi:uncharacterized phage protein gp47/JayE
MATYGITPEGFVVKRLSDIKAEIEASLRESFGDAVNTLPESVFGQMIGILSERESLLWELSEGVYNSMYPLTAEGSTLNNVVSLTGITRQPGVKSSATLSLFGTVGVVVASGTSFSVAGSPTSLFTLGSDITLAAGNDSTWDLTFDATPDSGDFALQYKGVKTSTLAYNASAEDVKNALNALSSLSSVLVTGDIPSGFNIVGELGELFLELLVVDNTLSLSSNPVGSTLVNTTAGLANGLAIVEAAEIGSTSAPSGSLTVIENPVSGLDSITNLEDATLGRDIESDADLKVRRAVSLQRAGAGTLGALVSIVSDIEGVSATVGFENITMVEAGGIPAKAFELILLGGDNAEIGSAIWDFKPAGIQPFGGVEVDIVDGQGFPRKVYFSRPTEIDIYVEIDLTVDPATFPLNGEAVASANILAFGNSLEIGEDVIVVPQLISAMNGIEGITDIAVRIGKTASPTLDDNVIIEADEISNWDSARITVVKV